MARRVTSEYSRLRPLIQRDQARGTTIVRQVTSSGGISAPPVDLSWVVPQSRTLFNGAGILPIGDLSADRTIALHLHATLPGLTADGSGLRLGTPGSLAYNSTDLVSGTSHTHAVTASSDPGVAAALLKSDTSGNLGLQAAVVKEITTRDADGARNLLLNPVATGSVLVKDGRAIRSETFTPATFPIGGWGIEAITGTLHRLAINKIVADELRVKIFVADETRVDRGILYVTKGYGILAQAFTTPSTINGTANIYFENSPSVAGALFGNNDWVAIQLADFSSGANLSWTWGRVTSYAQTRAPGTNSDDDPGEQRWTFTLKYGDLNAPLPNGAFVLGWGQPGQGYITLDAVQAGVSPSVAVHVWGLDENGDIDTDATPYGVTTAGKPDIDNHPTKAVMGLLWSALDNTLTPSGWGFYSDNAYLRGELRSTNARLDDEGLGIFASSSSDFSEIDVVGFRKAGVTDEPLFTFFQGYWGATDVKGRVRVQDDAATRNATLFLESIGGGTSNATASLIAKNTATDTYGAFLQLASTAVARGTADLWAEHSINLRVTSASGSHATNRLNVQGNVVPLTDNVFDLGTSSLRWRKLYVDELIAASVTGETITMSGQEWTYAGDMLIDANSASDTILYVRNDGGGVASLYVEGEITGDGAAQFASATVTGALAVGGNLSVTGTVDGVDVGSHAANVDAHHARDHSLTGSTHTVSGLTTGHVLRATSATAFGFGTIVSGVISDFNEAAQDAVGTILTDSASIDFSYNDVDGQILAAVIPGGVSHNSLAGLTTGDPHTQYVALATARTITAQHSFSPGTAIPPFTLGANAQGQTVTGLRADQLNKSVIAGTLMAGGGALTGNVTVGMADAPGTYQMLVSGATTTPAWASIGALAGDGLVPLNGLLHVDNSDATITIAADGVAVNQGHTFTWTGAHQFTSSVQIQNNLTTRHILPEATDTYDIGSATALYRQSFISQMNAVLYAENTAQLIGGWFIIPKYAGKLGAVASGATQVDLGVASGGIVATGDFVLIRAHDTGGTVKAEYMQVGAFVSGTTWNVTRDLAGAHVTDPAWADGTPYLLQGANGDGRIELNASDTPRISLIRQGAAYNAQTEIVRLGDLDGSFAYGVQTWGMTIGQYGVASNSWLAFDESNGIRLGNNTTVVGWWRTDGSVQIGDGNNEHLLATPTALQFRDGATVTGSLTGTEWILGQVGAGRNNIRITDSTLEIRHNTTVKISLDASGNASFSGSVTASGGTIGGFTIGASALTAGSGGTAVGIAPASYPFYAGNATPASAPFRVTNAGALVATNATLAGAITWASDKGGADSSGLWLRGGIVAIGTPDADLPFAVARKLSFRRTSGTVEVAAISAWANGSASGVGSLELRSLLADGATVGGFVQINSDSIWLSAGAGGSTEIVSPATFWYGMNKAVTGNGSAAAPAHAFTGDPDSGMYWVAANTLGFSTAGTVEMTISESLARLYPPVQMDSTLTVTGATTVASLTSTNWASFNGGAVVIQYASSPYYGVGIQADGGSNWSRQFGFFSGATNLGGFGALGGAGTLSYWYVGRDYTNRTLLAYPDNHGTYPGEVLIHTRLSSPYVNATTAFERDGIDGTIFVPVTSYELQDTTTATWAGSTSKSEGAYVFDINSAANGSLSAEVVAVCILLSGTWSTDWDNSYMIVKPGTDSTSDSDATIFLRAQRSGGAVDTQGVVGVDANGQFCVKLVDTAGSAGATNLLCRLVGYYI